MDGGTIIGALIGASLIILMIAFTLVAIRPRRRLTAGDLMKRRLKYQRKQHKD